MKTYAFPPVKPDIEEKISRKKWNVENKLRHGRKKNIFHPYSSDILIHQGVDWLSIKNIS